MGGGRYMPRIPNYRVGGTEAWLELSKNKCRNPLCNGIRWASIP